MTDASLPARKEPHRTPDRMVALGHAAPSRKHPDGPPKLTARHQLLIEYQVAGCPYASVAARVRRVEESTDGAGNRSTKERPLRAGEPMTLIEAADCLRIRRRNARQLSKTPIFQKEMAHAIQEFREGEKLRSLQTMVDIRDEPGEGLAADRKVRLQAATALIGEDAGRNSPVTVNVGVAVTPGYVVRVGSRQRDRDTIEGTGTVVPQRETER